MLSPLEVHTSKTSTFRPGELPKLQTPLEENQRCINMSSLPSVNTGPFVFVLIPKRDEFFEDGHGFRCLGQSLDHCH